MGRSYNTLDIKELHLIEDKLTLLLAQVSKIRDRKKVIQDLAMYVLDFAKSYKSRSDIPLAVDLGELNNKMNEVVRKVRESNKRITELEDENDELRREMRILAMEPDSPEAHVIRMQTVFAKELEESHKTGEPLDTPKLLGLYGKMMNPIPKHKKLPGNESELKEVLGSFYKWTVSNAIKYNKGVVDLINKDIMDEMLNIFIDKLKDGDFG